MGTKASGRCLASRTWGTVARDWRGSKDIYSEWSKLMVELQLGALNGDGVRTVGGRPSVQDTGHPNPSSIEATCRLSTVKTRTHKSKTQVHTTNLGYPPCCLDWEMGQKFLARLTGV